MPRLSCHRHAVPLSSLDDVTFEIIVDFKSGGELFIGQSGVTLAPTTTAAKRTEVRQRTFLLDFEV